MIILTKPRKKARFEARISLLAASDQLNQYVYEKGKFSKDDQFKTLLATMPSKIDLYDKRLVEKSQVFAIRVHLRIARKFEKMEVGGFCTNELMTAEIVVVSSQIQQEGEPICVDSIIGSVGKARLDKKLS